MADPVTLPFQEIVAYGGMAVGAALAAFLVRLGWKKLPTQDTELAISGQASIVDTTPIRKLLTNVDLLTLQMQKAALQDERRTIALEALSTTLGEYLASQAERQEKQDTEAEIARRVAEELKDRGLEPATQAIRKR